MFCFVFLTFSVSHSLVPLCRRAAYEKQMYACSPPLKIKNLSCLVLSLISHALSGSNCSSV